MRNVLLATCLLLLAASGAVLAAVDTMPLADVRPGMRGTGRTVIRGTSVVDFDVEILGVLHAASPAGDLILVRVGGAVIETTGGIAAGMSGSPVFVDGKLVGAISYGFSFADSRVGYVTPIEEMLEVARLVRKSQAGAAAQLPPDLPGVIRLATPVMVGGVGPRGFARLAEVLKPLGLLPVQAGGATAGQGEEPKAGLEPGAAFGAQLVSGDMDVTAIGTVTYVDGDTFLGFGHPFMNKGQVNVTATRARIFETVKSVEAPFKIGAPLEAVGALTQDRPTAVGGLLGASAPSIPLKVIVREEDGGRQTVFDVKVVKDEELSLDLLLVSALQGLDKGLARIGKGTSEVTFSLRGQGVPGGQLSRTNMYFHPLDISAMSLRDFMEGVRLLLWNKFQPVDLQEATMTVNVRSERRTAEIERAEPERPVVKPGEKLGVTVTVRPYRRDQQRYSLTLPIPADLPPGRIKVVARGGGFLQMPADEMEQEEGAAGGRGHQGDKPGDRPKSGVENLDKLVQEFLKKDKNNDLVLEFWPVAAPGSEGDEEAAEAVPAFKQSPGDPESEPVRVTLSLPFVVEGSADFDLTVMGTTGKPKPPAKRPGWFGKPSEKEQPPREKD